MATSEEESGFDVDFADPPSDHFKCVVCHNVLRNPVQLDCGHRYCSGCFDKFKRYSQQFGSPLVCPIDREEIDLKQVFTDKGMARLIADLQVKCTFNANSCSWIGELRDLDKHRIKCSFRPHEQGSLALFQQDKSSFHISKSMYQDLYARISKSEQVSMEKDKEIAHIKFQLNEMNDKLSRNEGDLKVLKKENDELKTGMVTIQGSFQRFNAEERNLSLKEDMVTNFKDIQNQIKTVKENGEERITQVSAQVKAQIAGVEKEFELVHEIEKQLEEIKSKLRSGQESNEISLNQDTDTGKQKLASSSCAQNLPILLSKHLDPFVPRVSSDTLSQKFEDHCRAEGLCTFEVKNVSKIKDTVLSDPVMIRNLPWKIILMPKITNQDGERVKSAGIFVQCDPEGVGSSRSCQAHAKITLKNKKGGDFTRKINHVFSAKEKDWGYSGFIPWVDIIDPGKGYNKNDSITIEAFIQAEAPNSS